VFFPHLIAGPIVNHRILMRQFMSEARLRVTAPTLALGISLFVFGLAKKVLFADSMALRANLVFDAVAQGGSPGFADAWIGALAYSLQLYFDFSGYSDMAIGLGLLFGVRLPLNFNSPYKAANIIDFWRRWHMSLSAFLRDYLYFSLGGNHRGEPRRYANLVITMLLGGLWHGAGWTFVCWGAFHGLGLMICHLWTRVFGAANRGGGASRSGAIFARVFTLLFVVFGWVMFRADSMGSASKMMGTMIGLNGFDLSINSDRKLTALATLASIAALAAIALFAPNSQQWLGYDPQRPAEEQPSWATRFAAYPLHGAAVGCLLVFTLTQMSAVQSFLYFQF
jgi:alginate O-acetyltransferase complex protein AlgI